jgi:hypothetical protein
MSGIVRRRLGPATAALALCGLFVVGLPRPASADVTFFYGVSPTPAARAARGFAFGVNFLLVGVEFEYASTVEDALQPAPGLTTSMANIHVVTPTSGVQLYVSAGGGFYREREGGHTATNLATSAGGGVKWRIAGPLRLRVDYRVFTLRGGGRNALPQRLYAGLNLSF